MDLKVLFFMRRQTQTEFVNKNSKDTMFYNDCNNGFKTVENKSKDGHDE